MSTLTKETFEKGRTFAKEITDQINECVSPFHSVATCMKQLTDAGFTQISEADKWDLQAGGKYVFSRNGSTIVAFTVGKGAATAPISNFKVVGCHTDSPCLKLAPNSSSSQFGYE